MAEEWRDVVDAPGYKVSNKGRIIGNRGWVLKPKNTQGTHSFIGVFVNNKNQHLRLCNIVASAFLDYNQDSDSIFHLDGNKSNNCTENLLVIKDNAFCNYLDILIGLYDKEEFVRMYNFDDVLVSNYGRFYSTNTLRLLRGGVHGNGYCLFATRRNGKQYSYLVHRVVADHFCERPSSAHNIVHHIDGNKENNHWSNLEWVTASQNTKHAVSNMPSEFVRVANPVDANCDLESGEEIKPCCVGDKDAYMVSSFGRVYSNKTKLWMRQAENSNGYLRVEFRENGKRLSVMVHRLVAHAFVAPNYNTNLQVNHIDGNRTNNVASNLEWETSSDNSKKRYHETESSVRGNRKTAMSDDDLKMIRHLYATGQYTYKQIGAMYDVRLQTISNVVNRLGCYKDR